MGTSTNHGYLQVRTESEFTAGDPPEIVNELIVPDGTEFDGAGAVRLLGGGATWTEAALTDYTDLADAVTTLGADATIVVDSATNVSTSIVIPDSIFLRFAKGALLTKAGSGSIEFEGIGLADPLSQSPIFSGFAVGDITWTGTDYPHEVSNELWDTSNTSLSDRLNRANAAFGTKQVKFVCYPRTITANVDFFANTEIEFKPGDYPNTFSWPATGNYCAFGLDDNSYFHGPRSAVINESTGTYGARIIQPASAHTDIWTPKTKMIVEGLTFKGHPSATSDGSGSTVLMGNCQNSAIRWCHFDGVHNYASILGGAGTTGKYAYNSQIVANLYTNAATQAIAIINGKNCRIAGNWMDGTGSTNGGVLIDIEPNAPYDAADDITVENNVLLMLDPFNGTNTLGGIAVQAAGATAHIKGCVVRGNTVLGMHPSGYVPSSVASRMAVGIQMIGVVDGVCADNYVRWGFNGGYQFTQCRRMTIRINEDFGSTDASGFSSSLKLIMCADSQVGNNILREAGEFDSSTGILEREFKFPAVSSGSLITTTPVGAYRFFSFQNGLNVFFNGSTYTIVDPTTAPAYVQSATDINTTTDVITKTAHGYNNGDMLRYNVGPALTDAKIGGMSPGVIVFVVNKTANDFQISLASGGSAINLTSTGTGTQIFFPTGILSENGVGGQGLAITTSVGTVTTKTFTNADVNTGTDTITITAHGYQTGCIVNITSAGTLPTFATNPVTSPSLDGIPHWYVIRVDANTVKLATNLANALASTASDITASGSGTTTVTPELETRFSNNEYSDNVTPDGLFLEPTGTSRVRPIDPASFPALTGDVTTVEGSVETTITDRAVTFNKLPIVSIPSVLGANVPTVYDPVTWESVVGCSVTGIDNRLTRTLAGNGWTAAGAYSEEGITADGELNFTVTESNTHRAIGLTTTAPTLTYATMEHAIVLDAAGTAAYYENNVSIASLGALVADTTTFKIKRVGTVITVWKNGADQGLTTASSTGTLHVDAAIHDNGATIGNVTLTDAEFGDVQALPSASVKDMLGLAFYTATLTPASVAANTSAEETFTVTGLAVGDDVVVNGPAPTAGTGIVNARVSATNTLALTFGNFTGGALTPTSGAYNIRGFRS